MIRPGGTALNSTQVSGMRIADYLSTQRNPYTPSAPVETETSKIRDFIRSCQAEESTVRSFRNRMQSLMTEYFAFSRDLDAMERQLSVIKENYHSFSTQCTWARLTELPQLFKNRDMLLTQLAYAQSMLYSGKAAGSRGGALVLRNGKELPEDTSYRGKKILTTLQDCEVILTERAVRPLPFDRNLWFETVWKQYLEKRDCI